MLGQIKIRAIQLRRGQTIKLGDQCPLLPWRRIATGIKLAFEMFAIHLHTYNYTYTYIDTYLSAYIHIYTHKHTHIHTYTYKHMYIYVLTWAGKFCNRLTNYSKLLISGQSVY